MKTLNKPDIIFFDASNTLFKPTPNFESIIGGVLEKHRIKFKINNLRKVSSKILKIAIDEIYNKGCRYSISDEDDESFWTQIYGIFLTMLTENGKDTDKITNHLRKKQFLRHGDVPTLLDNRNVDTSLCRNDYDLQITNYDPHFIGKTIYFEMQKGESFSLFPEVLNTLNTLKKKGVRIGMISNFSSRLRNILLYHNIQDFFDPLIISAEVNYQKPEPEIFEIALKQAKVNPIRTIHIGDNPIDDVEGALKTGIMPILIIRNNEKDFSAGSRLNLKSTIKISSLDEILNMW